MPAYYNEHDPYAAEWLRNLIAAGEIAPGVVDERSIEDVVPADLVGYTQCHFFAGIGGWSKALRLAGWPDSRTVWTGSCPCQPFSAAGKGAGIADERHLWPAFHHLIRARRPGIVFGEQVASAAGLEWWQLVHDDLAAADYQPWAVDLGAPSVGAAHIRQRLWWLADTGRGGDERSSGPRDAFAACGSAQGEVQKRQWGGSAVGHRGAVSGLGDGQGGGRGECGDATRAGRGGHADGAGGLLGGLADTPIAGYVRGRPGQASNGGDSARIELERLCPTRIDSPIGATNGLWRDADWLLCRDGKWRPVEPGTFPLAHGVRNCVGRLRAYGNAIVPQVAAEVIAAYMDVLTA